MYAWCTRGTTKVCSKLRALRANAASTSPCSCVTRPWTRGGPDRDDARVRIRTAKEGGVQHPVAAHVRGVPRGAGDLVVPLDAPLGNAEDVGHPAVFARHCANWLSSWSALRWITGWPNSP